MPDATLTKSVKGKNEHVTVAPLMSAFLRLDAELQARGGGGEIKYERYALGFIALSSIASEGILRGETPLVDSCL